MLTIMIMPVFKGSRSEFMKALIICMVIDYLIFKTLGCDNNA